MITQPHLKEVVVVDDGSTESETDIIGEYAPLVRLISQEHAGIGAARNRGVDQATGEYLSFIDADDIWAPEKLRLQIEAIRSDDAVDAVLGSVSEFISPDLKDSCAYMIDKNRKYYAAHVGSMLIRRSVFMESGPFETWWKLGEWIDW